MLPMKCPICKKSVSKRGDNPTHPFCSTRCRKVDLGQWLGGDYAVADTFGGDVPAPMTDHEEPWLN